MTYIDPKTGRERNLGQDDLNVTAWLAGLVIVIGLAFGAWYFYDQSQKSAGSSTPNSSIADTSGTSTPTSGPGVQGAPAARTVLRQKNRRVPHLASTGSSGSGTNMDTTTQPSQDSHGVQGSPGGKTGPAENSSEQ